ncbi:uncharacterized protein [Dysidea avara]|uniref:uncharacterized protein n=1 Tax=Dysidea avara TaxID=196820 RepID=UPI0033264569
MEVTRLLGLFILLLCVVQLSWACGDGRSPGRCKRFWRCIRQGTSSSVPDARFFDNGTSIGPMGIRRAQYDDAVAFNSNLQSGQYRGFGYRRCFGKGSYKYSRAVGNSYLQRYCTVANVGREPTFSDCARIHMGGPNGHNMESTRVFGEQVQTCARQR